MRRALRIALFIFSILALVAVADLIEIHKYGEAIVPGGLAVAAFVVALRE